MSYIKDLEDNLAKAELLLEELKECLALGYYTAADVVNNHIRRVLKSTEFCCTCAKRKADKLKIPYSEFKCSGGCVRGTSLKKFSRNTQRLWYVMHWTRWNDKRYDKDGRFLGHGPKQSVPHEAEDEPKEEV